MGNIVQAADPIIWEGAHNNEGDRNGDSTLAAAFRGWYEIGTWGGNPNRIWSVDFRWYDDDSKVSTYYVGSAHGEEGAMELAQEWQDNGGIDELFQG